MGLKIYCFALLLFLFLPTITIVLFSFESSGNGSLPFEGFSTRWYEEVLENPVLQGAFRSSALVAIVTALMAVILGALTAYALYRRPSRAANFLLGVSALPLAIPPLVLGISLLSLFKATEVPLSLWTVSVGHILITIPVALLTLNARFGNFDPALEEAARDMGATPWQTFSRVTFPLIRPSVIGAGLLALALSLDEFIVSLLTIGPQSTVPIVIWGQMRRGVSPTVNAISSLLLLATLILVLLVRRFSGASFASRMKDA
jgi:spermidine/putrescine transport system permease protein